MKYFYILLIWVPLSIFAQEISFTTLVINNLSLTEAQVNADNLITLDVDNSTIAVLGVDAITNFTDVQINESTLSTSSANNLILGTMAANEIIIGGSSLTGNIDAGVGNDVVRLTSGILQGNIDTGVGNDVLSLDDFMIEGNVFLGTGTDRLVIVNTSDIRSLDNEDVFTIDGEDGSDTLFLGGSGERSLSANVVNFEFLEKDGSSTWTLNGDVANIASYRIFSGILAIDDFAVINLDNSVITVDIGATFRYEQSADKEENSTNGTSFIIKGNLDVISDFNIMGGSLNLTGVLNVREESSIELANFNVSDDVEINFEFDNDRETVIVATGTASSLTDTITLRLSNSSENNLNDGDSLTVVDFSSNPMENDVEIIVETPFLNDTNGVFVVSRSQVGNDIILTYQIRRLVLTGAATIETETQMASSVETPEINISNFASVNVLNNAIDAVVGFEIVTLSSSASVRADSTNNAILTTANDDTVSLSTTTIEGNINLEAGVDNLTISESSVTGNINTGAGNDIVSINGSLSRINGSLLTGDGEDTILINGGSSSVVIFNVDGASVIDTGADNDRVTLRALIFDNDVIDLGSGNDSLILQGNGELNASSSLTNIENIVVGENANWVLTDATTVGTGEVNLDINLQDGLFVQGESAMVNLGGSGIGGNITVGIGATYSYRFAAVTSGILFGSAGGVIVDGELDFEFSDNSILITNFINVQGRLTAATMNNNRVHIITDNVALNNGTIFDNVSFSSQGTFFEIAANGSASAKGLITINLSDTEAQSASFADGNTYTLIDGSAAGVTTSFSGFLFVVNDNITNLDGTFIVEANGSNLELVFRANITRIGAGVTLATIQTPLSGETILVTGDNVTIDVAENPAAINGYEVIQLGANNRIETDGTIAIQTTAGDDSLSGSSITLLGGIATDAGNDSISLISSTVNAPTGVVAITIATGAGEDNISFLNTAVNANVLTGSENDVVSFAGFYSFINNINLGGDDDELTLGGSATFEESNNSQIIDGGVGMDILTLSGSGTGSNSNEFFGTFSNFETVIKLGVGIWSFQAGSSLTTNSLTVEQGSLTFEAGLLDNEVPPAIATNGANLTVTGNLQVNTGATLNLLRNAASGISADSSITLGGNIITEVDSTFNSAIVIDTGANDLTIAGQLNLQTGSSLTNVGTFIIEGNVTLGNGGMITFVDTFDLDGVLILGDDSAISTITTLDLDGRITFGAGSSLITTNLNLANNNRIEVDFVVQESAEVFITAMNVITVDLEDVIEVVITNSTASNLESGQEITLISSATVNTLTVDNFIVSVPNLQPESQNFRIEKQGNNFVIVYTQNSVLLTDQTLTETQSAVSNAINPSITINNTEITITDDTNALENFENVVISNSTLTVEGMGSAIMTSDGDDMITLTDSNINGAIMTSDGDDMVILNNGIVSNLMPNLSFDFGANTLADDGDEATYEGDTLVLNGMASQVFNYTVTNLERLDKIDNGDWTLSNTLVASDQVNIDGGELIIGDAGNLTTANLNVNLGTFSVNSSSGVLMTTNLNIANGAIFNFISGTSTITNINLGGELAINDRTLIVNSLNISNRAIISFNLNRSNIDSTTPIITTTTLMTPENFDLFLRPTLEGNLREFSVGDSFTILASTSSELSLDLNQTTFTSGVFSFDIDTMSDPNQLKLVIADINTFDETDADIAVQFRGLTGALERLNKTFIEDADSAVAVLFDSLNQLSSSQRAEAITYISPTVHTSVATRLVDTVRDNHQFINNRLHSRVSNVDSFLQGPDAENSGNDLKWWVDYSFSSGSRDTSTNASFGYEYDGNTVRLGLERQFSSSILGVSLAYNNISITNNANSGFSDEQSLSFDFYYSTSNDDITFDFLFDYSTGSSDNQRNILGAGNILETLSSDIDTYNFSFSHNTSVKKRLSNNYYFFPTIGLSYSSYGFDAFDEIGNLGFSVKAESYIALNTRLGFRLESQNNGDIGKSATFFKAFWNYNFGDLNHNITAKFNNNNLADSLRVSGIEEDASTFTLGVGWHMSRVGYEYGISYDYNFSSTSSSSSLNIQYKHKF